MYNECYQPGVIFVCWDIDFILVTNIAKAPFENVSDDWLHLCIFMSLSDTEEIMMLSLLKVLSGDCITFA